MSRRKSNPLPSTIATDFSLPCPQGESVRRKTHVREPMVDLLFSIVPMYYYTLWQLGKWWKHRAESIGCNDEAESRLVYTSSGAGDSLF